MNVINWELLWQKYEQFYIFMHIRPDGDTIGSSLAWGKALQQKGKIVKIFCPDFIPYKYTFLPNMDISRTFLAPGDKPTMAFVIDCSDLNRLDYLKEDVLQLDGIFNIDHHRTNLRFGDYNIVEPTAAATGEIIYRLILELGLELTEEMSLYLYTALASDTGSFKYENTTPQTMSIAAKLLEKGVNPSLVSTKIFDEISFASLLLLRVCLQNIKIDDTGKIAWMSVDESTLKEYGVKPSELEGYINYAKNVRGVEVGVFFHHTQAGETRVAFRSKSVNISTVAFSFGGGGHKRAAGCSLYGKAEEIENDVIQKVADFLVLESEEV